MGVVFLKVESQLTGPEMVILYAHVHMAMFTGTCFCQRVDYLVTLPCIQIYCLLPSNSLL